jgi:pimeloyl-ACP methyl ester carboxylesterase
MDAEIRNPAGERLEYAWHAPDGDAAGPPVVLGHGVTANMDRAWAVALATALAAAGFPALRFSFAGNGGSEGDFGDSCPSKEADDLGAVLDALEAAGHARVAYVGHSMGAAVGVLRAARDPRIERLVSLGGMVDTADFAERKFGHQQPGDLMWDKPECPLSQAFLDDMRAVGSVEETAAGIALPWLLVHGDADTVVPPEESERLAAQTPRLRALQLLPGADHVFSGGAEAPLCGAVVDWLRA